jgi:hypothetical protein
MKLEEAEKTTTTTRRKKWRGATCPQVTQLGDAVLHLVGGGLVWINLLQLLEQVLASAVGGHIRVKVCPARWE